MIRGYFIARQPGRAIELVEQMAYTSASKNYTIREVPPLCSLVYSTIIDGFFSLNDPKTAMLWFDEMLKQRVPAPSHDLAPCSITPVRPGQIVWESLFDGLYTRKMVAEFNRYSSKFLTQSKSDRRLLVRLLLRYNI